MAYVYRSDGNSPTRVWTTENRVVALKFRNRLINAKDIASINVFTPTNERMFRAATVQLSSGEKLTEVYRTKDAYVMAGPQWAACTLERVCEDLVRVGGTGVPERFSGTADFVAHVNEDYLEEAVAYRGSKDVASIVRDMVRPRGLSGALANFTVTYSMKFGQVQDISDIEPLVQKASKLRVGTPTSSARWNQEREAQEAYLRRAMLRDATNKLRQYPSVGTKTNCGPIFEVRLPQVGVTTIEGPKFVALADLYAPGVACYLVNGKYDGARVRKEVENR
ncbi:hypothetical protein [Pandoraea bronchicola]|uniref:hypothetical protein n=1 Tax=Pandoraea bronchicola TaxID=2508287 RepID=UPI001241E359|nr:hypothetical protein [Pandoraea bronchicola]